MGNSFTNQFVVGINHAIFILAVAFFGVAGDAIPGSEYSARREKLMETMKEGVGVVIADKISVEEIDMNTKPCDFYYLAGWHKDGSILVLQPEEKRTTLFADFANPKEREEVSRKGAIDDLRPIKECEEFVRAALKKHPKLHAQNYLRGEENRRRVEELEKMAGSHDEIGEAIAAMRIVKSEGELDLMRKAAGATTKGLVRAMKEAKAGMNEGELQKIIEKEFADNGCSKLSFPSIIGSGKNGTTIHYMKNSSEMADGTLVVCDVGGSYEWYASDITRTIPVNGKFTDEQKELYSLVLETQKLCEQSLKPGTSLIELDKIARAHLTEKGYGKYFLHYLGHFVGLAVHDSGHFGRKLEPGMVITIEPGVYIADRGIGIRIEDTYIVTKEGCERISAAAPREIAEIEKVMSKK